MIPPPRPGLQALAQSSRQAAQGLDSEGIRADKGRVEAAHIAWRPLGRLLVEQGLLTDEELELALTKQQTTGRRLGETIVECGFVSPPDLSNALAAQYGIELKTETGFGTGLRALIQHRHENYRGRPTLISVPNLEESSPEPLEEFPDPGAPSPGEAILLAQLEEQWAKLAAAEEWLAERERELAVLAAERDRRRDQAERLSRRAWSARTELEVQRERRRTQIARFVQRVRVRDRDLERRNEELSRLAAHASGRQVDEQRLAERERELTALAVDRQRLADDVRGCDAEIEKLRHENTRRRAQATRFVARLRGLRRGPGDDPAVIPVGHLVFVQLAGGYHVVEREGSPPALNTSLELPELCGGTLMVASLRRSPLPGDARPCVVAQPA